MFRGLVTALFLGGLSACSQSLPAPQGVSDETRQSWLGIEYAQAERWALPELNQAWMSDAPFDDFGPDCPQDGQSVMIEDCLFLNVFAPQAASDLPVIVWIHGGGFRTGFGGGGPNPLTDHGFVVVTFNYRLGELGFGRWAGWDETDAQNFGQADMVKALKWVQSNIERFGGDPNNVTLVGHSAGGMGVQLMMVDDRADGLFHKAWSHAGYGAWPFPSVLRSDDEIRTRIRYGSLESERQRPAMEIVARTPHYHLPLIGTPHLPDQPATLFKTRAAQKTRGAKVPYVAGANSYDGAGTLYGAGFTPQSFLARIDSPALRTAYAADFAVSEDQAAQRIFGDLRYLYSSLVTAKAMRPKAWMFYFDERRNGAAGAFHGQQYEQMWSEGPSPMRDALISFAKTGEPGWPSVSTGGYGYFDPIQTTRDMDDFKTKRPALMQAIKALEET